jgi:hypothetical protein
VRIVSCVGGWSIVLVFEDNEGIVWNAPGLEGKYFFRTSEQAEQYGQMMNKAPGFGAPNFLTSGTVPTSALSSAEAMEAGSEGPRLFFCGDLSQFFDVTNHGLIP